MGPQPYGSRELGPGRQLSAPRRLESAVPRDLADVLHYFMPDIAADEHRAETLVRSPQAVTSAHRSGSHAGEPRSSALPLAALPIADHEIVRASLIANLSVEIAALGGDATILTPATPNAEKLFPPHLCESPRARVQVTQAKDLASLHSAAVELAEVRGADENNGGIVLVRIPPLWLQGVDHAADYATELFDWLLLFTSPDQRNLAETYTLAALILKQNPTAEIGLTVHGAKDRRDAADAFGRLARSVEQRLGLTLASYGLLVEDLDIYRALVAGRTVGRAYPGSISAQALREAAQLVFERACKASFK